MTHANLRQRRQADPDVATASRTFRWLALDRPVLRGRHFARVAPLLLLLASACATDPRADLAATPQAVPEAVFDPRARALLEAMSSTLAAARTLALKVETQREVRIEDGQVATLRASPTIVLRRPDRLRADLSGDRVNAQVLYDGQRIVVYVPASNVYAVDAAPPTIDGLLTDLETRLGIPIEISDFLVSNPIAQLPPGLDGRLLPDTAIDGKAMHHLLLVRPGARFELWLPVDRPSLPRRMLLVRDGRRVLQDFVEWRIDPRIEDRLFAFEPPPGSSRIPFATRREALR